MLRQSPPLPWLACGTLRMFDSGEAGGLSRELCLLLPDSRKYACPCAAAQRRVWASSCSQGVNAHGAATSVALLRASTSHTGPHLRAHPGDGHSRRGCRSSKRQQRWNTGKSLRSARNHGHAAQRGRGSGRGANSSCVVLEKEVTWDTKHQLNKGRVAGGIRAQQTTRQGCQVQLRALGGREKEEEATYDYDGSYDCVRCSVCAWGRYPAVLNAHALPFIINVWQDRCLLTHAHSVLEVLLCRGFTALKGAHFCTLGSSYKPEHRL